jgi:hypothetical protein
MIVEYIRYQIPEDEARSFEDAYRSAGSSLEASPHCQRCASTSTVPAALRRSWAGRVRLDCPLDPR